MTLSTRVAFLTLFCSLLIAYKYRFRVATGKLLLSASYMSSSGQQVPKPLQSSI
ncbi:hypothetical protein [Vibrio genomosp. F6]|uniref:hypothetical protein n=1 Tax=Vibrio genomosp. F6 TaxID=723172 RepID=UPI001300FD6D|nr:hypothetical protein [Vibrio genomosp. F6]